MSWISWGLSSTNPQYEELVEKACSPLNLAGQPEDIALNLEICDLIRSKAVQPKPAMQALKKRIATRNGRVQISALSLIDTCIKNGGDHFLLEIASKEFIDEMTSLIKSTGIQPDVHNFALRLFQQWALAFESKPELSYFVEVYKELKLSGIKFPPPPPALPSHLLTTSTAPTWVDSDTCMRCRAAFTFTNRKHHCRNCGQVFDQACSSRNMPIPRFGITQHVRVCEGCYIKSGAGVKPPALPANRTPRSRRDMDADLQRAIELSLAESNKGAVVGSEPPLMARSGAQMEDDDEEFRMAIEASLRESERARPSAPNGIDEHEFKPLPTFDLSPREAETILTFSSVIDQATAYGERDLRRFPHAHDLYAQAYAIGGKLQRNVEEKGTKQQMLGEMQHKINEAIGLYGALLDRQREYAERARYAAPPQPAYGYAPQPAYPGYAPPQQQQTGSSLYPSLQQAQYPSYSSPQQYPVEQPPQQAQLYPQQSYLPQQAHQPFTQQPYQQGVNIKQHSQANDQHHPQEAYHDPQQQYPQQANQPEHAYSRQQQQPSEPSQPPVAYPQSPPTHEQRQPAVVAVGYPASVQPYAPPPVDLSTHPTSPQRQTQAFPAFPTSPQRQMQDFPAFPSAPVEPFVEPKREEPKEALLIEL